MNVGIGFGWRGAWILRATYPCFLFQVTSASQEGPGK